MVEVAQIFNKHAGAFDDEEKIVPNHVTLWQRVWAIMRPLRRSCDLQHSCFLGVVGARGTGKSTFINTILGADILPTEGGEAATASVIEVSSSNRENFVVYVDFLPPALFANIFKEAHAILLACGDEDLQSDPEIEKAKNILKAHEGEQYDDSIEFLRRKLEELSHVVEPHTFILENYREHLRDRSRKKESAQVEGITPFLKEYASMTGAFWPIVDRVRVIGPFHRRQDGLLKVGMTVVDIPGDEDGHVNLTERNRNAIISCNQRVLLLSDKKVGTIATRNTLTSYYNGFENFSIIVPQIENIHDFKKSFSQEEFADAITRKTHYFRETLKRVWKNRDGDAIQIYLSELRPAFNEGFYRAMFEETVTKILEPREEEISRRAERLRTLLDITRSSIQDLANDNFGQGGVGSTELLNSVKQVFLQHRQELNKSLKTWMDTKATTQFPIERYDRSSPASLIALFRETGLSKLRVAFENDLENAVCSTRDGRFHESMFNLDALWGQIRQAVPVVNGDKLDYPVESDLDITMEVGRTQIRAALFDHFRSWAANNQEKGKGARDKLAGKLKGFMSKKDELKAVAESAFLKHRNTYLDLLERESLDSVVAFNSKLVKCDHGGKSARTSSCACSHRRTLLALFPKSDPTSASGATRVPSTSILNPSISWRTIHQINPDLTQITGELGDYYHSHHSQRASPGMIVVVPHETPDFFRIELRSQDENTQKFLHFEKVKYSGGAVFSLLQEMLSKTRVHGHPKFYHISLDNLKTIVSTVASSVDDDLHEIFVVV